MRCLPFGAGVNFSSAGYEEYTKYANQNNMIIPLLEDRSGFDNAEEIFAMLKPGVDAIGTGMGDLAFSLTKPEKR